MFDEIDEGTCIFKVDNNPPVGKSEFLTYEGLPSDYYLWQTGQAGKMLRKEIPLSKTQPIYPN
jgi:glycoprotein endo-alpha-1,2-mannosidase